MSEKEDSVELKKNDSYRMVALPHLITMSFGCFKATFLNHDELGEMCYRLVDNEFKLVKLILLWVGFIGECRCFHFSLRRCRWWSWLVGRRRRWIHCPQFLRRPGARCLSRGFSGKKSLLDKMYRRTKLLHKLNCRHFGLIPYLTTRY